MKKTHCSILVLILTLMLLVGCNAQPAPSQSDGASQSVSTEPSVSTPVTLNFWNGFTGPDGDLLKQIVEGFNDANAGSIEIKMDIMSWDVIAQKLPPAIATETAPGLALLIGDTIPGYLTNDALKPLDDFWTITGLKENDYVDSVLEAGKYNGKYYALPMQYNLLYLYWNKDLFEKAGLDPETPPSSLEEMGSFAERLTDANNGQYGLGLAVKAHPEYWTSFFWNNGGELFDTNAKKSLINSPENINTLIWMRDLIVNKKVGPVGATGADIDNLMLSGKLGMFMSGPWMIGGFGDNEINFGITAIPKGSTRQQIITGQIGFVVPSSATEAEQKAAYEFIKYWMSDEISKEWSIKNGFPVWKKSLLTDPDIQADPIQKAISDPALTTLGRPYNPDAFTAITTINNDAIWAMIESVFVDSVSPEDALKLCDEKINQILLENE